MPPRKTIKRKINRDNLSHVSEEEEKSQSQENSNSSLENSQEENSVGESHLTKFSHKLLKATYLKCIIKKSENEEQFIVQFVIHIFFVRD